MASVHDPINDVGPEFARKFSREMFRIAREVSRFDRAIRIQAAVDKLRDEEAYHAPR